MSDYSMSDSKDWTWVLQRPCSECGFDGPNFLRSDIASTIRAQATRLAELARSPLVASRPAATTWSAHEYLCHVRDVYELYAFRLDLMLTEDDPLYPNWDQDETAANDVYTEQDLGEAVEALVANGHRLAAMFDGLADEQWDRPGRRSDGAGFTVDTFGRYLVHDPHHHIWDIEQGYVDLEIS